ncbi:MAG TPA: lactonase family protein [Pyrinomonadaceae bacterium]|nr:lactonase family protein [Pyrinomonadaceae bacterium]
MKRSARSRREFLKLLGVSAAGVSTLRANPSMLLPPEALTLYVGTYTSGKSEGIYVYRMGRTTGELKYLKTVKGVVDPSFLSIDSKGRYLFAVNEMTEFAGKPGGAVSAFRIDDKDGNLKFLNQEASLGGAPCHVIVDATDGFVLLANYVGGNLSVLPIRADGTLGPASDMVQHLGSSINKERQEAPHAHCIILDPSNQHAFAADLGLDKIMIYRFDSQRGKLTPGKQPWAQLKPGAGPRHFKLHPNGRFAYVINELDSTVTGFNYDRTKGTLSTIDSVSTLPKEFSGKNSCADLHVAPSGRFLYGSNRGHDSIVVFAIDESNGRLNSVQHVSTQGKTPRNFAIDPSGRFLLAANQASDTIVTFQIDQESGRLTATGHVAEVPTPVCLLFGPVT